MLEVSDNHKAQGFTEVRQCIAAALNAVRQFLFFFFFMKEKYIPSDKSLINLCASSITLITCAFNVQFNS